MAKDRPLRRRDLRQIQKLARSTGMLHVFAEQVVRGKMSREEALKRSFGGVHEQLGTESPDEGAASQPTHTARLTFELGDDQAHEVLLALRQCRLLDGVDQSEALVRIAQAYLEEHPPGENQ